MRFAPDIGHMTYAVAAQHCGCSVTTIRRAVERGEIYRNQEYNGGVLVSDDVWKFARRYARRKEPKPERPADSRRQKKR